MQQDIAEALDTLERHIQQIPDAPIDPTQTRWIRERVLGSVKSVRLLLENGCYADALVIQRVILEHVARLAYGVKNNTPPSSWKIMIQNHEHSVSKILFEILGDSTMYSWLSAFTHPDIFSLSLDDATIHDEASVEALFQFSIVSTAVTILVLISEAFPTTKDKIEPDCMSLLHVMLAHLSRVVAALPNYSTESIMPHLPNWIGNKYMLAGVKELLSGTSSVEELREQLAATEEELASR